MSVALGPEQMQTMGTRLLHAPPLGWEHEQELEPTTLKILGSRTLELSGVTVELNPRETYVLNTMLIAGPGNTITAKAAIALGFGNENPNPKTQRSKYSKATTGLVQKMGDLIKQVSLRRLWGNTYGLSEQVLIVDERPYDEAYDIDSQIFRAGRQILEATLADSADKPDQQTATQKMDDELSERARLYLRQPENRNWQKGAKCAGMFGLFHSEYREDQTRAKGICQGCPVRIACLADALTRGETLGIQGGYVMSSTPARSKAIGDLRKNLPPGTVQ